MAAFFTADQLAALSAGVVRCDYGLVKFDFLSGALYAWNGNTPLTVGGHTYQPMHGYGQIDGLGYAGGTASEQVTLSLNGLPGQMPDLLAKALADTPEADQQLITISLQLFDEDWQPIGTPIPHFFGFMQPPKVSRNTMQGDQGATQTISIGAENIFFNRAKPPYGRNTDRDQQARSPGDKFFGFVNSLLFKVLTYPDY